MTADLATSFENMQIDEMSPNVSTIRLYATMGMIRDRNDWDIISRDTTLDDEFIDIFADDLNWTILVKTRVVSAWLIGKYGEKISSEGWHWIANSSAYSKTGDVFVHMIWYAMNLIDWKACTKDNYVNLKEMLDMHLWIDWKVVSESIDVFDEYVLSTLKEYLEWPIICRRTSNLSEMVMMDAVRYIDWSVAAETQYLSPTLIEYLLEHRIIDVDAFNTMCHYQKIPDDIYDMLYFEPNWDIICHHQVLSEECMAKYADRLNWLYVASYQLIGIDFYERFADRLPIVGNVVKVLRRSPMVHPLSSMDDLSYPEVFFMEE